MKFLSLISAVILFVITGCKSKMNTVTKATDYEVYMKVDSQASLRSLQKINTDIDFWTQRMKKEISIDPVSGMKLAELYAARFRVGGNIQDIHISDSLYLLSNPLIKLNSSSVYKALAANCITQHKFQQAKLYIDSALQMGDEKYISLLMLCDVSLELGNIFQAKRSLSQIKDKNDFDYLIREAKLLDHEGDLPAAIKKMEKAAEQVAASNNDKLFCWAKTNLADMYGHDNRFSDAYRAYLEVLNKEPENLYALKGIAWLAFSHDRNTNEAKHILKYLSALHPVPDYDLLLAEIEEYENNSYEKERFLERFTTKVNNPLYGDMYNKYVFYLFTDEIKNTGKALSIAEKEVSSRPTAQSFDLLAWAKYQTGKKEEAVQIMQSYVENKNFEPEALYHLGVIYAGIGNSRKAKNFLKQAQNSVFELGPVMEKQIKIELEKL